MSSEESTTNTSREIADDYLRETRGVGLDEIDDIADRVGDLEARVNGGIELHIDGSGWRSNSEYAEYDAAHAVAGALLGGADEVLVERVEVDDAE
ncbi:hypothetical protein Hbl1158_10235 [Halobaculum sp. CBA1158]|uniref:hypothetical protein n=1 Tax=Halobaculum sp. CBA1158 TaxID=2904243 RepID=UPI001F17D29C|nr:hypothetical protein [Halobaculum sp. CBA1158]UIO98912.1 hypothetical protein Hbl1158_10235 [Halobaculum sp. CBA1158]